TEFEDAARVGRVIAAIWGEESVLAPPLVRAFQHAGSILFGATAADGELVGFVFGFLGFGEGVHVHSHMLAVLPNWQARGAGHALKLAQRAACLDHGIDDIRWTYDPLVARNARFNLVKLGAVASRFLPEFYGEMNDLLNRGDRSDRFEIRWRLSADRVERAVRRELEEPARGDAVLEAVGDGDSPRPHPTEATPVPGATVAIPPDFSSLRARDAGLGRAWREASGEAFEACFAAGLKAVWMTKDSTYIFAKPTEAR
ncbi:MAG TPA: GNAT family N-acetyltransferase, partial [Actinomycetota bacterium]